LIPKLDLFKSRLNSLKHWISPPWRDDLSQAIIQIHNHAISYGINVHNRTLRNHSIDKSAPVHVSALHSLHTRVLAMQRATFALIRGGWAHCSAPGLRTMLESVLSMSIILKGPRDYLAFKYFCAGLIDAARDRESPMPVKEEVKRELQKMIGALNGKEKKDAEEFIKNGRIGTYWFSEQYRSIGAAIQDHIPGLMPAYKWLAGASHAGYTTTKLFYDAPEETTINPVSNPSRAKTCAYLACRFSMLSSKLRSEADGFNLIDYGRLTKTLETLVKTDSY
jgi:hypothetical protein